MPSQQSSFRGIRTAVRAGRGDDSPALDARVFGARLVDAVDDDRLPGAVLDLVADDVQAVEGLLHGDGCALGGVAAGAGAGECVGGRRVERPGRVGAVQRLVAGPGPACRTGCCVARAPGQRRRAAGLDARRRCDEVDRRRRGCRAGQDDLVDEKHSATVRGEVARAAMLALRLAEKPAAARRRMSSGMRG